MKTKLLILIFAFVSFNYANAQFFPRLDYFGGTEMERSHNIAVDDYGNDIAVDDNYVYVIGSFINGSIQFEGSTLLNNSYMLLSESPALAKYLAMTVFRFFTAKTDK